MLFQKKLLIAIVLAVSFMTIIYADEDTELTKDEFTGQKKKLPLVRTSYFCRHHKCCNKAWGILTCVPCASCRHYPHANYYDGTPSHNPLPQYQGDTPHKPLPQYQGDTPHKPLPQYQGDTPHKPLPQYQGDTPHKPLQYLRYDGTPSHKPQYQGK